MRYNDVDPKAEIGVTYEKKLTNDTLTMDEVAWAIEQGAKSEDEITTMIYDHRQKEQEA